MRVFGESRERRVMFRVSQDEYEQLQRICQATAIRSISELVREAVQYWIKGGDPKPETALPQQINRLEQQIAALRSQIAKLAKQSETPERPADRYPDVRRGIRSAPRGRTSDEQADDHG